MAQLIEVALTGCGRQAVAQGAAAAAAFVRPAVENKSSLSPHTFI